MRRFPLPSNAYTLSVCARNCRRLNSTVSQLAKAVNMVLSKTYNMLYADDDAETEAPAQLKLQTSPLAASEEIEKLFTSQIIDLESALPAALHALGATTEESEKAMKRGLEREQKKCDCEDVRMPFHAHKCMCECCDWPCVIAQEDRKLAQEDQALSMKERTLGLEKTKADIKKVRCATPHATLHAIPTLVLLYTDGARCP